MDDFFVADPAAADPDARLSSAQRKRNRAAMLAAQRMGGARAAPATRARRPQKAQGTGRLVRARPDSNDDDDGDDDDDDDDGVDDLDLEGSGDDDAAGSGEDEDADLKETPAQKRLRLAKRYLAKVREDVEQINEGEIDAAEIDRELIADRLRNDILDSAGKLFHRIADKYANLNVAATTRIFRPGKKGHQLSITGVAFSAPAPAVVAGAATGIQATSGRPPMYIFSVSKDAMIVKWDFWTGHKLHVRSGNLKPTKKLVKAMGKKAIQGGEGHSDNILALDVSSDGKFVATGGLDKSIHIWSGVDDTHLAEFKQHRDAVTGLKFRRGHNELYSTSYDRSVKVWNADELSYVETLFGHQDQITSVDALARERCVTAGARDRTVRLWKIPEESQLVFRAGGGVSVSEDLVVMDDLVKRDRRREKQETFAGGVVDVVALIDEEHFVSGSDSGAISLWNVTKKKPFFTRLKAHGPSTRVIVNGNDTLTAAEPSDSCNWITALASMPYSDLFASGSCDGYVKLWKVAEGKRHFVLLNAIPVTGFVNSLAFFEAPLAAAPQTGANDAKKSGGDGDDDGKGKDGKPLSGVAARIRAKERAKLEADAVRKTLHLAIGTGQEHRLGRWWRVKDARNQIVVVGLAPSEA
ncbi:pre-rRNA processing protein [Polyrhizophydium stewartii]|uniref:Pre-rRNA processing protein n=1 Tax=Polyrhizophydium stewartii TaxID=2732419 RepID=A0ABR4N207_9FUNG|nr:pre-rRNA processing protein [Polyrhizophydium stewartii]